MSLSPAARDLRLFQYLAPNTFSQLLVQSPTASKSLKKPKSIPSQTIDSAHEETDADPSLHAQPPAPTPSIKSEPDSQATCLTHDVEDPNQDTVRHTAGLVTPEVVTVPDDDEEPARLSSPFSADIDSVDHGYMSDADLPEKIYRASQGYNKLSLSQKKIWEAERAKKLFEEGKPKHFECLDHLLGGQPCTTLQEYLPARLTSRTVISSFFGHNKGGWSQVPKSVRVFLCRKCYQRHENDLRPHMAPIQLPLCREFIDRLERWRPGCLFTIQLTTAMERKVEKFNLQMEKEGSVRRLVAAEVDSESLDKDPKRIANTPVLFAIKLHNRFGGNHKTASDLRNLLDWLETKLGDGTTKDLPAFEALLEKRPQDMERKRTQQESRKAFEKTLLMKLPEKSTSAPEQTIESEDTPTHRPARAALRKKSRPARGTRATKAASAPESQSAASRSVAPKESTTVLAGPSALPKIKLKLKVKKPIRDDPDNTETQPRVTKKRKRTTVSTTEDSNKEAESTAPAKKAKVAEVANAPSEQSAPVDEVASEQQHMDVTNGNTYLACLDFSSVEVILDFAPGS